MTQTSGPRKLEKRWLGAAGRAGGTPIQKTRSHNGRRVGDKQLHAPVARAWVPARRTPTHPHRQRGCTTPGALAGGGDCHSYSGEDKRQKEEKACVPRHHACTVILHPHPFSVISPTWFLVLGSLVGRLTGCRNRGPVLREWTESEKSDLLLLHIHNYWRIRTISTRVGPRESPSIKSGSQDLCEARAPCLLLAKAPRTHDAAMQGRESRTERDKSH